MQSVAPLAPRPAAAVVAEIVRHIKAATNVLVLTGAGVSTGVPGLALPLRVES